MPNKLPCAERPDTIGSMAGRKSIATTNRVVRARVRGTNLDLLERVPLRDGDEVLVTISEPLAAADVEALHRAAGGWAGMLDADALIANVYADRLVATRPLPHV
jgi:hypothetical protein